MKPAPRVENIESVRCPDGSECNGTATCCRTKSTSEPYGCCPEVDAVCCEDRVHCCPKGYECSEKECIKSSVETSLPKLKIGEIVVDSIRTGITCPDGGTCTSDQTCCLTKTGKYGCCPSPDAVCCSDQVHCCPQGFKCEVATGQCAKEIAKTSLIEIEKRFDIPCGTSGTSCNNTATCCKLKNGSYGCCPLADAVCCADHTHCCPEGYRCSDKPGECIKGYVELFDRRPNVDADTIRCDDGTVCASGTTCCKTPNGTYGCCPAEGAVCCADLIHCCPHGTTCDLAGHKCREATSVVAVPLMRKLEARVIGNVVCPDQSLCPNGDTCCEVGSGVFGCCPSPNAVCCADGKHCCKTGFTCVSSNNTCSKDTKEQSVVPLIQYHYSVSDDICPGGTEECKGDNVTCCRTSTGFGCCPLKNAVCCSDLVHCCPNGYACDTSTGKCNPQSGGTTERAEISKIATNDVACPDGSSCPTNDTCCKTATGYGCCPLPFAVCCADMKHCCPNDYACESGGMCVDARNNDKLESTSIVSTIERKIECPDGGHCREDSTCCRKSAESNIYGCCPFLDGVCCLHNKCCPNNTRCNSETHTCDHVDPSIESPSPAADLIPELEKTLAMIRCPDKGYCTDDQTCCKRSGDSYGCCPYQFAVCCNDSVHCCKKGYTCADNSTRCIAESDSDEEASRIDALVLDVQSPMSTCPDGHNCTSAQTCCQTTTGHYGCCPAAKATCCRDNIHCCKAGYKVCN